MIPLELAEVPGLLALPPLEQRTYGSYDYDGYMPRLELACRAVLRARPQLGAEVAATLQFAESAFRQYLGRESRAGGSTAFLIPTFLASWQHAGEYNSQIQACYPIAPYLTARALVDITVGVPPLVIDSYPEDALGRQGHVVFAPLFPDMLADLGPGTAAETAKRVVADAARFAVDRLGATVVGLGATLPHLTELGNGLHIPGAEMTTGHGGTVWLVAETLRLVLEGAHSTGPVGVLGARGAIGRASLQLLIREFPSVAFRLHDLRGCDDVINGLSADAKGRVVARATAQEVLAECPVTVSAVTSPVQLTSDLDLRGKFIIDDSQPPSCSADEVAARGGTLVGVVAHDFTGDRRYTRLNGFRFGDQGLKTTSDLFGCEAETLAVHNAGEGAVRGRVTHEQAAKVGHLMSDIGIRVRDQLHYFVAPAVA